MTCNSKCTCFVVHCYNTEYRRKEETINKLKKYRDYYKIEVTSLLTRKDSNENKNSKRKKFINYYYLSYMTTERVHSNVVNEM